MTKPYRAAIIGAGDISNAHVNALNAANAIPPNRVEIMAAADIDAARAQAFCAKHHIPRWFDDWEAMLSAVQPDLVHIVTPPGSHCEQAIASLEAGAWVYCEKPLVVSLEQFDRISEAETRTGRYVSTVFQWRFGSAAKHVKRLIESGEMGRPLIGVCQTLWYRPDSYYQLPWRGKWATETGGVASIMGIHLTDLYLWLMGSEWQEVRAMAATLDRPIEVEDVALAMVRFENGAMGSITSSAVSPRQETYLRLDFQQATIDVTGVYGYTNANWRFALYDGSPDDKALQRWSTIEQDVASSHTVQITELLDSMDNNQRPLVSGAEARRIIEFLASLYKSAFTGEAVERGSIIPGDPFYSSMNGLK